MSLTRARSPSSKNGLPDLRLLPDAPVPDGRTVLTSPDADRRAAGRGSPKASAAFHMRYEHRRKPAHADLGGALAEMCGATPRAVLTEPAFWSPSGVRSGRVRRRIRTRMAG